MGKNSESIAAPQKIAACRSRLLTCLLSPVQSRVLKAYFFRTCVGIKCIDGVVLAHENLIQSKLLVPGGNTRIQTIDMHIGFVGFLLEPWLTIRLPLACLPIQDIWQDAQEKKLKIINQPIMFLFLQRYC